MNEMNLAPISGIEKNTGSNNAAQFVPEPKVERNVDQQPVEVKKPEPVVENRKVENSLKDVELKFVPDQNTKEITVFVVDKTSKNVLRSIPPEEIEKMSAGDLLEIIA